MEKFENKDSNIEIPDEISVLVNNNGHKVTLRRVLTSLTSKPECGIENKLHRAVDSASIKEIKTLMEGNDKKQLMKQRNEEGLKPFHKAIVKLGDDTCDSKLVSDIIDVFLKNGANLASKFEINGKAYTSIEYIFNNIPRPMEYLQNLFDDQIYIANNKCIQDNDCIVAIDYGILRPNHKKSPIQVLVALVQALKNHNKSILLHPLVESFLHQQWNKLRRTYTVLVLLYFMFVLVMSWMILRTYKATPEAKIEWVNITLSAIIIIMILLEVVLFITIVIHQSFMTCLKQPVWLISLCSKVLLMIIIIVDHSGHINEWPKMTTASASLLAWFEIMFLISHYPECDSIYQMFMIVMTRALKVFLVFGVFIIIGFSMSFWVIFQGTDSFSNYPDTLVRTIVMTNEFDFLNLYKILSERPTFMLFKFVFVIFIFFVPIVMLDLILGLIINDIKELQQEGRMKSNKKRINLIDTIITVSVRLTKNTKIDNSDKIVKLYPGKSYSKTKIVFPENLVNLILEKFK